MKSPTLFSKVSLLGFASLLILANTSCGSSYIPNESYQGTASGNSDFAATLTWTVNTNYNSENLTGVFDPLGTTAPISLVGQLTQTGVLTATGGAYTFTGSAANGILLGTFSGTNSGNFSTLNSTENTITQYCGTFTGSTSGIWNMESSSNAQASASSVSTDDSLSVTYSGSSSNNVFTLSNTSGASASGTRVGTTITGTWDDGNGASGTFSSSSEACQ